ncbi:chaperone protein dnaJ 8, chloroplastic-like [Aristolochia californica]|uniref:chaperone protein dnaJ 8, chloroplastic-like n=1 Tax=Aristolochia californica TaxID=171875 RepID=UPI0035D5593D
MANCMKTVSGSWMRTGFVRKNKTGSRCRNAGVVCSSSSLMDQYKTLRIQPGASEKEVKHAFRQLALQYHPDVCKGNNCGVQFHRINEAYDMVMSNLRESDEDESYAYNPNSYEYADGCDEPFRGMYDSSWDLWEEWMGWEGAGIRDFSSHINPYI